MFRLVKNCNFLLIIYIYKDESKFVCVCVCVCHAPFEKGKPHRRG